MPGALRAESMAAVAVADQVEPRAASPMDKTERWVEPVVLLVLRVALHLPLQQAQRVVEAWGAAVAAAEGY